MARRDPGSLRALVTGASGGIGRALAIELARRGARLLLMARNAERLAEVAAECQTAGGEAHIVAGDVTQSSDRLAALAAATEHYGGLDLLVNNAGVTSSGDFAGSSPEIMRSIFEVNYFAATELTREAIPLLREGNTPMIVNIGSILGHRAIPLTGEYCASKFALTGWTQSLRAELASQGIDVLLVSPGTTNTEFHQNVVKGRSKLPWAGMKGVSAEHVARAAVQAIARGKHEIVPNWRGWWMLVAHRLAPTLLDHVMAAIARKAK
ncbi:SDR family oxidoreductase [Aeoliella mucimassa]|uniref:Diacetyl reductase [(S)-acetoin forming] n=1 Tax=Aeoliella mucimassa TaxID=2527972 RepID=A0A518ARD4_9BACT|nr:SDR family oxidoreductase [Aeoliella mucimassa]QDU57276.1 Diacetyl reductase [(S)-acetoin forming] [Aeoliella mucimassa]